MTGASFGKYQDFGKYRVVEKIGAGGFGEVFKGLDPFLNRPVAIKTCSSAEDELRRRFLREAEIAANLQHPNVVTIFDFGHQDETPYLVQEFLSGEDLDRKIGRREPADLATRLDILLHVAKGLEYAHSREVVHRDVKPANVRILDDGQVRIMDFGIAKLMTAETQLTRTGMALGTAAYLPPEQIMGLEIDPRADLFSYGVLAYELMTWQRPFAGDSLSAMLYAIAHKEPEPLAGRAGGCPPRLAALIETCLAKDPEARYPGFAPVIAELESLSAMPAIPPLPPPPPVPAAAPQPVAPPAMPAPPPDPAPPVSGEMTTELHTAVTPPREAARQARVRRGRAVTWILAGIVAAGFLAAAGMVGWWLSRESDGASAEGATTPATTPAALPAGAAVEPRPATEEPDRPIPEDVEDLARPSPAAAAEASKTPAPPPPVVPPPPVAPPPAAGPAPAIAAPPRAAPPPSTAPRQAAPRSVPAAPPPPSQPAPLIVSVPRGMEIGRLADGQPVYADRAFTYRDVPWNYRQLPCLRTANDLKRDATPLSLTLGRSAEVFVAHDLRIKDKPEWLATFENTGLAVRVDGDDDDRSVKFYEVFVREFPPGTVSLGPNLPAGREQDRASMYTVFFREKAP